MEADLFWDRRWGAAPGAEPMSPSSTRELPMRWMDRASALDVCGAMNSFLMFSAEEMNCTEPREPWVGGVRPRWGAGGGGGRCGAVQCVLCVRQL